MATINEVPRMHRWLKTILSADATLSSAVGGRFYQGHVPQGQALPACVFSVLAFPDDLRPAGSDRLWAKATVLVKIVGETNSDATLQTAADRVDAVLHAARGGTSDVAIDYCIRKRPFYLKDTSVANKVYTHLGGEYEIAARYAP
jgi:hypothetical protein